MLSKFLRPVCSVLHRSQPLLMTRRSFGGLIPKDQYDYPMSKRFHLGHVVSVYWETIPLFFCSGLALACCGGILFSNIFNKVDIVFTVRNRNYISRTMDLRHPTIHKLVTINQTYPPWDQMQDVLDKMKDAEKRILTRAESCSIP